MGFFCFGREIQMAVRIKMATLFSIMATTLLISVNLFSGYIVGNDRFTVEILTYEILKYTACFILISSVNYMVAGPIMRPLSQVIKKIETASVRSSVDRAHPKGDEFSILENGFNQLTATLKLQNHQINAMNHELIRKNENMSTLFKDTISALSKLVYARDPYTASHSTNVSRYAKALSEKLRLNESESYYLEIGALLHDIGKVGVPENILSKTEKLTESEFAVIRKHPEYGFHIINEIEELRTIGVSEIVLYHHERMDGRGYPRGLSGYEIPLPARIVSICDAFDAMTTSRSYRPALDVNYAIEQLRNNAGHQFDPYIVEIFIQCLEEDPSLFRVMEQHEKMLASV